MPSWDENDTSGSHSPLSGEYPEGGYTPNSIEDPTFCGIALNSTYVCCVHKELPERHVAYEGRNTGRRFLACAVENEVENCGFVEWIDPEWPDSMQYALHCLWSKLDEVNCGRMDDQFENEVVVKNLKLEKKELEKKYNDLVAQVNKMMDGAVKEVQLESYIKFNEEKHKEEYEACEKARIDCEAKLASMELENRRYMEELAVLKSKNTEGEKETLKQEKKRLEYMLFDLVNANSANKQKLKSIQQILDGTTEAGV